ncbi:hypothetical protein SPLC1_S101260 [Arthrospira platensis C1]|nr:hypothetical protein SPLC1_S101260 [Arthrospira platensis C1]
MCDRSIYYPPTISPKIAIYSQFMSNSLEIVHERYRQIKVSL